MNEQKLMNAIIYAMRRAPVVEDVPSEGGDYQVEIYEPESLLPFCKELLEELKGQQHDK